MKKAIIALSLTVIMAGAVSTSAFAGHRGQVVNQRQQNQNNRIQQGVQSGELNRREAHRLRENRQDIRQFERRSRRDGGGLSEKEAQRLDNMQDRQSQAIYNQKHDEQDRH